MTAYQYQDMDGHTRTTTDEAFVVKWAARGVEFSPLPQSRERRYEDALREIAFPPPVLRGDAYSYSEAQRIARQALNPTGGL